MRTRGICVRVAVGLLAGASGPAWGQDGPATAPARRPGAVNVVVFAMESLRRDAVGVFGAEPSVTPTFDRLAREAVLFEDCSAAAPEMTPAAVSLLTGASPCELRCWTYRDELTRALSLLKSTLEREAVASVAITDSPNFSALQKADSGFGELLARPQVRGNVLKRWLRDQPARPFFAYLHERLPSGFADTAFFTKPDLAAGERDKLDAFTLTLEQYRRAVQSDFARGAEPGDTKASAYVRRSMEELEASREFAAAAYRDAVHEADNRLATVIEALQEEGEWERTVLIVVGLTGVGLGQRDGWLTGYSVYEELIGVPALIRFPKGEFAGQRITHPVSSQDLMPTVFDYAGWIGHATALEGVSQLPALRDPSTAASAPPRVVSVRLDRQNFYRRWNKERGERNIVVRDGPWKLIQNSDVDTAELYRLDEDPGETNNRIESDAAVGKRLRELALAFEAKCGEAPRDVRRDLIESLDEEALRVLREAGVVGEKEGTGTP